MKNDHAATSSPAMRLVKDDRGVILVVGVFFTFFWIGMIWFLFGIGNVIAYRENMQNAADAAAFAGAVYDARGMNMIAMINNLMGLALATVIIQKFSQISTLFSKGEDCHNDENTCEDDVASCADIFGGEIQCAEAAYTCPKAVVDCIQDCDDVNQKKSDVQSFDRTVHATLNAMHTAEVLIAKSWPYLAAGKSGLAGTAPNFYANGVTGTASVSYSQNLPSMDPSDNVPTPTTGTCPSFSGFDPVSAEKGSGTTSDGDCGIGPRCGLPVTSDHYSTLCHVAMDNFTTAGGAIPANVSKYTKYASEGWYIFGAEWFCDDNGEGGLASGALDAANIANPIFTTAGTIAMSGAAFWECELVGGIKDAVLDIIHGGSPTDGNLSLIPMSGPKIPITCPAWSPMAIYAPATMGLDYYGVWGTANGVWKGDNSKKDFAAGEVQISALEAKSGSKVVVSPPDDADTAVARAEFYYEPMSSASGVLDAAETIPNETTIMETQDAARNVMWNMRWRARLRRFHFMPGMAGLGAISKAGYAGMASYYEVVAKDVALLKVLGENGSIAVPSVPDVDSQNSKPPTAMYH